MADPLTILGATAASTQLLIQGTKAIAFLWDLQSNMKAAPAEVKKQTVHVEQLISLTELFKNSPSLHVPVASFLETCLSEAQKILALLQKVTVKDGDSRFRKVKRSFGVARKEKEILRLFVQLEREKALLVLRIQEVDSKLLHTISLDAKYTKDQLDEVTVVVKDTAHNITTVVNALPVMSSQLAEIQTAVKSFPIHTAESQSSTFRSTTHFLIPNRLVEDFFGREDVLARIAGGFSQPKRSGKPKIVSISGLGGQGKTQLALEHCRRAQENGVKAIFWINSMSKEDVTNSFKEISEIIKDPEHDLQDSERVRFVLQKLTTWPDPWLVVFDNHDDPSAFVLREYFPGGDQGCILITSRHASVDDLSHENAIELDGLSENDGLDLLFHQSRKQRTEPNAEKCAREIVRRLGYHALAIAQAGSYIKLRKLDLDNFIEHFERQKDHVMKHTLYMSEYRRQLSHNAKETTLNVFTTWELSFQLLKESNKEGESKEDILKLFAFFDSKDISEELFRIYCQKKDFSDDPDYPGEILMASFLDEKGDWDHNKFEGILIDLIQMTLVQSSFRDEKGAYRLNLHPLIRDWIRLRTGAEAFENNSVTAARILQEVIANSYVHNNFILPLSTKITLISHVDAHIENFKDLEGKLSSEAFKQSYHELNGPEGWFSDFLNQNGRIHEAVVMARRLATWRDSELGTEDKASLTAWGDLADILKDEGEFKESAEILRRVIDASERRLGPEHEHTLIYLNNFAIVLSKLGQYNESEETHRRALQINERDLGLEHPDTLLTLNNLALVLGEQGKYKEAEEMYRRTIPIEERVLGLEHPDTLQSLNNLALVLSGQDKYQEAEEMDRRTLQIKEKVLGLEHPATLQSLNNLALVLSGQGKYQEAEEMDRRTLQIKERVLGLEHPDTLLSVWNLARLLEDQGGHDGEALGYLEQAATGSMKVFGADHPTTIKYVEGYASFKEDLQLTQKVSNGDGDSGMEAEDN